MSALPANHHKDKLAEEAGKISMLKNAVTSVARQGSNLVRRVTRTDSQTSAASAISSVEAEVKAEGDNAGPPSEQETEAKEKELRGLAVIAKVALIQGKSDKFDKSLIPTSIFQTDLAQLQVFGVGGGGKGGLE
jgi:hypothetical protein